MKLRKSPDEIAIMRRAGRVVAEMHEACTVAARAGASTADLDRAARDVLERRGARSNFLGYHGFPAVVCTSRNAVVVHGIPDDAERLEDGDIVSIDCGAIVDGWHADAALTVAVGDVDDVSRRLLAATREALERAIDRMVVDGRMSDIGAAVQETAERAGFGVVRDYVGHGIGTEMHEEPPVPNHGPAGRGIRLREGMVLAVEPMVSAGATTTRVLGDGWTVVTSDGSRSAHFEHTVAITPEGPLVLTAP